MAPERGGQGRRTRKGSREGGEFVGGFKQVGEDVSECRSFGSIFHLAVHGRRWVSPCPRYCPWGLRRVIM